MYLWETTLGGNKLGCIYCKVDKDQLLCEIAIGGNYLGLCITETDFCWSFKLSRLQIFCIMFQGIF